MGIADRDYHRNDRRGSGGFFSQVTPVVKWLLLVNLGIYFLDLSLMNHPLRNFGAFTIQSAVFEFRVWEFVTFQFLHGSLGHVFFNCMGIFFFGPFLERWWGAEKFLIYYLLCGVAGAVFFTLLVFVGLLGDRFQTPLVGASAGIYGILTGVAVIARCVLDEGGLTGFLTEGAQFADGDEAQPPVDALRPVVAHGDEEIKRFVAVRPELRHGPA